MQPIIDLHSHTIASDGTLTPTGLIHHAHVQGVNVLAVTDHDVTDGLQEAFTAAAPLGIQIVPGVEISVTWNNVTVHILGLNVDPESEVLQQGLDKTREFREWRGKEIARRLESAGVKGAYEGAMAYSHGKILSRTHFAQFLADHGYARNVRQVFKNFLTHNKPGYVPGQWAALADAVSWIRAAGGQAVIAHPARYKISGNKLRRLISEFKECGGVGIEVVSGSHSTNDMHQMAGYAATYELLASAGSDYHGPKNHWIDLGRLPPLPPRCVPIWQDWPINAGP